MNKPKLIAALVVLVLLGLTGTMFTLQNLERTSGLSFNVGVAGWELSQPAPVPYMIWSALGLGLVLGAAGGVISAASRGRRIAQLERDLASGSSRASSLQDDDWV